MNLWTSLEIRTILEPYVANALIANFLSCKKAEGGYSRHNNERMKEDNDGGLLTDNSWKQR